MHKIIIKMSILKEVIKNSSILVFNDRKEMGGGGEGSKAACKINITKQVREKKE